MDSNLPHRPPDLVAVSPSQLAKLNFQPAQGIYCQEEGDKNVRGYVQATAVRILTAHEHARRDVAALLRLMHGLRTGGHHKWAVTVCLHPHELSAQMTLPQMTEDGASRVLRQPALHQRHLQVLHSASGLSGLSVLFAVPANCKDFRYKRNAVSTCELCTSPHCMRAVQMHPRQLGDMEGEAFDGLASSHDLYRKTVAACMIALHPTTISKIVIKWGRVHR